MMNHTTHGNKWMAISLMLIAPLFLFAQNNTGDMQSKQDEHIDRLTITFSNEEAPKTLEVHLINGGVTVIGYEGSEAIIEARSNASRSRDSKNSGRGREGLRPLLFQTTGLYAEEKNNVLKVGFEKMTVDADLTIKVPHTINLKLECINNAELVVENVEGEMNVSNINGGVQLKNVSGVVVANTINGDVVVTLDEVTPEKSMSFVSMNGDIDVTLPVNTKADLKMETVNGQIYSDFDVVMNPVSRDPIVEDRRGEDGITRLSFDKAITGTINGGGPVFYFKNRSGEILIRKKGN